MTFLLRELNDTVTDQVGGSMLTALPVNLEDWHADRKRVVDCDTDDEPSDEMNSRWKLELSISHWRTRHAWFDDSVPCADAGELF